MLAEENIGESNYLEKKTLANIVYKQNRYHKFERGNFNN